MQAHENSIKNLLTPAERRERQGQHERRLLTFLRDETYSTTRILGELLGLKTKQGVLRVLRQMKKKGHIKSHYLSLIEGKTQLLWGITPHGIAMSFPLDEAMIDLPHFEPHKVSMGVLEHQFDIQVMRVKAEANGWCEWRKGDRVFREKGEKIPDAFAVDPYGNKAVIEVEKHIKKKSRYAENAGYYLIKMNESLINRVDYLCPNDIIATRLKDIFLTMEFATYQEERFSVSAGHFQNFNFWSYETWPTQPC